MATPERTEESRTYRGNAELEGDESHFVKIWTAQFFPGEGASTKMSKLSRKILQYFLLKNGHAELASGAAHIKTSFCA